MASAQSFNAQLAEAFAEVVDLPPAERQAFLDRIALNSPAVRHALDRLLAADAAIEAGAAADPLIGPVAAERAAMDPAIFPGFRVIRPLGAGTAGTVYEARQLRPNRRVAIKLLHDAPSPATADGFWHEADVLGQIRHIGVAQVYAADVTADGRCFLVMELVDGLPITEHAARRALGATDCVRLVLQVCDAIDAVHRLGVVHRDLKPGNVLVDETGRAKIVDFGIAAVATPVDAGPADADTSPTTSTLAGTLAYMSPERLTATARGIAVDARSDVYAIGVLLYELLAGRQPIDLRGVPLADVPGRVNTSRPPPVGQFAPACRGDLEAVVAVAMEKDPARRYPTAAALADDLNRCLRHVPVRARRQSPLRRATKFVRRHRKACVAAVAVLLLVGVSFRALQQDGRARANDYAAKMEADRRQQQHAARAALYESFVTLAAEAWHGRRPNRAIELLTQAAARQPGEPDVRGFEWHYLWRVTHPPFTPFANAHHEVRCVAVSPDGKRLASGGSSQTVNLYALDGHADAERQPQLTLSGHRSGVFSVDWSPDGQRLLSADFDGRLLLWDTATGSPLPSPPPRPGTHCLGATFRPDGRFYAATLTFEHVVVFDVRDQSVALDLVFPNHHWATQPAWSSDGKLLAVGADDGDVHIWQIGTDADGKLLEIGPKFILHGQRDWPPAVAFDSSGKTLACCYGDGTIRLWDVASRTERLVLRGHDTWVTDIAFSRDGKRLASVSRDQTLRVWDATTGVELSTIDAHRSWAMGVTFDATGRPISGGFYSELRRWNIDADDATAVRVRTLSRRPIADLAPSPDAAVAIGVTDSGDVVRSDAAAVPASGPAIEGGVFAIRPDGRQWLRAAPGEAARLIPVGPASPATDVRLVDAPQTVRAAAFDPADGTTIALATADGVALFDTRDGRRQATARLSHAAVSVAVAPGARQLAAAGETLTLLAVSATNDIRPTASVALPGRAVAITFSPDARHVVVATDNGHGLCVDAATGARLWSVALTPDAIASVAFSPDGTRLVTGTAEGTVQVREAATGRELLAVHDAEHNRVTVVGWANRGTTVYASTVAGQLFRWDAGKRP